MDERHSDNDGSDIFWPGYVDAVTNLVLNLLFLLTIMTVAVFMFALELGRASKGGPDKLPTAATNDKKAVSKVSSDPVKENIALKREIERLNMQLALQASKKVQPGVLDKSVDVAFKVPKSQNKLEKVVATGETDVLVRFSDDSVAFSPAEHDRLCELLKPVVAKGKVDLFVDVPVGFSEAKRMGFYRAMAVRNLLIEMKMPTNSIDVLVREGKGNTNAALVRVRSH